MEINSGTVAGICQQMCPSKEILMRETEGLLHQLEVLTINERGVSSTKSIELKADPSKIVKQFSRPAAGRAEADPSDLRPAPVLTQTVNYLFKSIVPREHPAWSSIYEFVFDRLRAIRQDMVIQSIVGADAISLLEQIVRFHLYASYRLRSSDISTFDPVINKQHLLECLKRLLYLYQITPGIHKNRPQFEGVYLLSNLGDYDALAHFLELSLGIRYRGENIVSGTISLRTLLWLLNWAVENHQLIKQCYEISMAYALKNYTRSLRLIFKLPCAMCLCAVNPHMQHLRIHYLQILSAGYSVKNCKFPVSKIRQLLHLSSDDEVITLCSGCGLVDLFDNLSGEFICFNRSLFSLPKESKTPLSLPVLDKLLKQTSLPALLLGNGFELQGVKASERVPRGIGRGRGRGRRE